MLPYKSLILIQRSSETPVYSQIANRLIGLIQEGLISPGSLMPSIRELSKMLDVHPKTIVAAYDEMVAQDWVKAIPKKGIFVSSKLPSIKPQAFSPKKMKGEIADPEANAIITGSTFLKKGSGDHRLIINDGFPDPRIAPIDLLIKEYKKHSLNQSTLKKVMFGEAAGARNLRIAIARFLSDTRGLHTKTENICITRGAQMALYLAARAILKPGSTVVVGEPNYPMANAIFEECGARLIKIPVDGNGFDVDKFASICRKQKPDLLYIIPHHHYPTTVTLSAERRMSLMTLVRNYDLRVIEDDYDYDFHYDTSPILPLTSYDFNGNIIYIGSISKSFATTLRIGYIAASPEFILKINRLIRMVDIRGDGLMEEALASLFRNGDVQRHLKKSLKLYRARRDFLYELLKTEINDFIEFSLPSGGMSFWLRFKKGISQPTLARQTSEFGLYMRDGGFYNTGMKDYNALRMGFASLNEKEMEEIIFIMRKCLV